MIELTALLGAGFVLALFGWAFFLTRISLTVSACCNALQTASKIREEIDALVKARVKVVNAPLIANTGDSTAPIGALPNWGSDMMVEEQPPITMSGILSEAQELEREMRRFKREGSTPVRDDWGGGVEEA